MHGLKTSNLIGHIVITIIQMEPNVISPESVKSIACTSEKINEIGHKTRLGTLGPLGVHKEGM